MDSDILSRQTASGSNKTAVPVNFTGNGTEYFKIWIVNILLTLLTLGIYNAWAKVRTKNYFYRNTRLLDSSFKYHATPLTILKGQLIAVAILAVYFVASRTVPLVALGLLVAIVLAWPWIMVRSMMFNAFNSSYRNVRFGFKPAYGEAYAALIGWYLLTVVSFGLLFPVMQQRIYRFVYNNYSYGQTDFRFDATVGGFYKVFLLALVMGIVTYATAIGSIFGLMSSGIPMSPDMGFIVAMGVLYGVFLIGFLLISAYVKASLTNMAFNNTTVGSHGFVCSQKTMQLAGLMLSNTILVVLTLGIYFPWAKVRMVNYALSKLQVEVDGDLDSFVAGQQSNVSATGEGMSDVFDLNVGI